MKYFNRLAELRGKTSQARFAEPLGLSQQNYGNYERGEQSLNSDLLLKIHDVYGCSIGWLLGLDNIEFIKPTAEGFVDMPLYGSIAAGTPIEMIEVEGTHPVPKKVADRYPESFLLEVKGESMNRILPNGCYALVDPCEDVDRDGQPYAVCVNGFDATVKRVKKLNNGFQLVPDSTDPTYAPETYNYNEPGTETITVIGRVVYYVLPFDWGF